MGQFAEIMRIEGTIKILMTVVCMRGRRVEDKLLFYHIREVSRTVQVRTKEGVTSKANVHEGFFGCLKMIDVSITPLFEFRYFSHAT